MSGRVFAAGESIAVFTPHDEAQNPIPFDKSDPLWAKLDAGRRPRHGRDLLLLHARRMLDTARWRNVTRHDD